MESIAPVFSDSFFAHVSYVDNGFPQCLPMIALFRSFGDDQRPSVWLHGHPTARLMELVKQETKAREESRGSEQLNGGAQPEGEKDEQDPRVKVCITATKVDALAASSAPNGHTFNYRCAVVHGRCDLVTSKELKRQVMEGVTNHIIPGRWDEVNPVSSLQISLVSVIRVDISSASLKARTGIPGIQPRNPEKDGPDREQSVWTGTIPVWEQLGEPIPSGLTEGAVLTENLRSMIDERNERHKEYALSTGVKNKT